MKRFLFITILCFPAIAWLQTPGFYGRKVSLELSGIGQYNFINKRFNGFNQYEKDGNSIVKNEATKFRLAYAAEINIQAKNRFSIGLEYSKYFSEAPYRSTVEDSLGYSYTVSTENIRFATTTFLPKIEFFHRGVNAPVGMSHQIGFGFTRSTVDKEEYAYSYGSNGSIDGSINDFVNSNKVYSGYTILYALNIRKALSQRLLFCASFRYSLNLGSSSSNDYAASSIARTRLYSPLSIKMGLAFMLF